MSLMSLFRRAEPPDGAVPGLEVLATGISPALLDASAALPSASRRERAVDAGSVMVMEALSQKVLHGWLQNRHQTLVPLTLNLRVLSQTQRQLVARSLAGLLLAGRPRSDVEEALPALRSWLQGIGAEPDDLVAFEEALAAPPTLDQIMERTLELGIPAYTYMAALTASDARFPASSLLCDVLQARFDLPTAVVRSIVRRHRR